MNIQNKMIQAPENTEYIIYTANEPLWKSTAKDIITLFMMFLCTYASKDSLLWSTISLIMFLVFVFIIVSNRIKKNKVFRTKQQLQDYIDTLP
jgi:hypothetical protein